MVCRWRISCIRQNISSGSCWSLSGCRRCGNSWRNFATKIIGSIFFPLIMNQKTFQSGFDKFVNTLIEIMAAAVFIIPLWVIYYKRCFQSRKQTLLYMVSDGIYTLGLYWPCFCVYRRICEEGVQFALNSLSEMIDKISKQVVCYNKNESDSISWGGNHDGIHRSNQKPLFLQGLWAEAQFQKGTGWDGTVY